MAGEGHDRDAPTVRQAGIAQDATAPASPAGRRFEPGTTVGRFVITERLGEGGMGIVLAAFDPTLDRKVAIKVLRSAFSPDARQRLLREAQALARLSHENVVPVYEAGEAAGEVYVVMELVSGQTLGGWLTHRRRGWREIVAVFVRAGRGLEAAHAAGLVHRDFKPENVLIGLDGRVRVSDFGLAASPRAGSSDPVAPTIDEGDLLAARLTHTGALVGTPAYMAPEQHDGRVDPRTDQFAFCVALYQALFDRLPFQGSTTLEYLANVSDNEVQLPPRNRAHPRWLWRAITRGLRAAPAERFPDMTSLLAEIDRGHRRRVTVFGVVIAAVVAVAFGAVSWKAFAPTTAASCAEARAGFAEAWNDQRRRTVRSAIARAHPEGAANITRTIEAALDERANDWGALRVEVCRASRAGSETADRLDLKGRCLDELLIETRALVRLLERSDGDLAARAAQAVVSLTPVERCSDARRLAGPDAPPADSTARAEIGAVRALLAESRALYIAARYQDSLALADKALERARRSGHGPVIAEALYRRAILAERIGPTVGDATALLRDTIAAAGAAHHDAMLVDAWTRLALRCMDESSGQCDPVFALQMARGALTALGRDDGRESALLDAEGWLAESKSDLAASRKLRERSLELAIQVAGGRLDGNVARAHGNLAQLLVWMGEDPKTHVDKAQAIYRQMGGPYHPEMSPGYESMAIYFGNQGKWKEAEDQFRRALDVRRHAFGEFHADVAASHNNIAFLLFQAKEYERCLTEIRQALAIYELIDPASRKVPDTAGSMGEALEALGRNDEALAAYQRALAGLERITGPQHRDVASLLVLLGRRNRRDGEFDQALSALRRAARIFEQVDGKQAQTLKDARAEIERAERHDRAE